MSQINDCVFIRRGCVVNPQRIVVSQCIRNSDRKIARITFLAVAAQISEGETGSISSLRRPGIPNNLVKALQSTVQSILTVIHGQLVLDAVQRKPAFRDPVSVTT